MFFKKKITYEDLWIELYSGYLTCDFSIPDALQVLGSDLRLTNKTFEEVMAETQLSNAELRRFGRAMTMGSVCAAANHFDQSEYWRFKGFLDHSDGGAEIKADLIKNAIPADSFLKQLSDAFLSDDTSELPTWMRDRSEHYGRISDMEDNIQALFCQANVLASFLVRFCRESAPTAFGLLSQQLHEARDSLMKPIGAAFRHRARVLKDYKTV